MEMINSGIYISKEQHRKLEAMATALGSNRNSVIRLLIDSAELPEVKPFTTAIKANGAGALREAGAIQ